MLLKCNECGHDNQLGAIFCRECGTKLDVEKMRPKVEAQKSGASVADILKNIFAVTVLLGLIVILGLMFFPDSGNSYELDADEQKKVDARFQSLINKIEGEYGDEKYVFTPDEVTYLYNNKLTEKDEASTGYAIEKMSFSLDSYDNVVLVAETKMFGTVPVSFGLTGYLEDENAKLTITSAKMGHLSIPSFARNKVIEKFTPGIDGGAMAKIIAATKKLIVENGDFHITVKELPKE